MWGGAIYEGVKYSVLGCKSGFMTSLVFLKKLKYYGAKRGKQLYIYWQVSEIVEKKLEWEVLVIWTWSSCDLYLKILNRECVGMATLYQYIRNIDI